MSKLDLYLSIYISPALFSEPNIVSHISPNCASRPVGFYLTDGRASPPVPSERFALTVQTQRLAYSHLFFLSLTVLIYPLLSVDKYNSVGLTSIDHKIYKIK